jgi:putative ATPase
MTEIHSTVPLAERLRPKSLSEVYGQEHLLDAQSGLIARLVQNFKTKGTHFPSLIFWGPPGTGKTTLAKIIGSELGAYFLTISAVETSVKDLREIFELAKHRKPLPTLLFVDEIHRFSKNQQDVFLHALEEGTIFLIGATTENPSFELNRALLSRIRVLTLKPLKPEDIKKIILTALKNIERGLGELKLNIDDLALNFLSEMAGGDARLALTVLDISAQNLDEKQSLILKEDIESALQHSVALYDKNGELHFDLISALHKSIRNSNPDATSQGQGLCLSKTNLKNISCKIYS